MNEHDPYEDVPPIDVEPLPSDLEDVVPADPSRNEPKLYYSSVHTFVDEFLTQIYDRPLGTGLNWCSEWWKHTEAVFYLTPGSSTSANNGCKRGGGVAILATPPPRVHSSGGSCVHPRGARPALGRPAHSPVSPTCPVRAQAGPAMRL